MSLFGCHTDQLVSSFALLIAQSHVASCCSGIRHDLMLRMVLTLIAEAVSAASCASSSVCRGPGHAQPPRRTPCTICFADSAPTCLNSDSRFQCDVLGDPGGWRGGAVLGGGRGGGVSGCS